MKTGIFLSYKGLGANLLHLSYCHEIAKKFGPITLITLNPKLKDEYEATALFGPGVKPKENEIPINKSSSELIYLGYGKTIFRFLRRMY